MDFIKWKVEMSNTEYKNIPMRTSGPGDRIREMFGEDRGYYIESFMNLLWHHFREGTTKFQISFEFKPRDKDPKQYHCKINFSSELEETES